MTTENQRAMLGGIFNQLDQDVLDRCDKSDPSVQDVLERVSAHQITPDEGINRLRSIEAVAQNWGKPVSPTYTPRAPRHETNSSALIRMHTATAGLHYGVFTQEEAGPDADLIIDPTPLRAARDFLVANGSAPSENPRKTLMRAIEMSMQIRRSNVSTDDFLSIYENLANKMLTKAWNQSDEAYKRIAGTAEVIDFKPNSHITAPEIPSLPKVPEHGEIERFALGSDSKETGQLETYGGIIGLSINAMVNGDINPFLIGVKEAVRAADRARGDAVFQVFTANSMTGPVTADGSNLFSASHSNWVASGSGAAPSADTVGTLRAMMQTQSGTSGSKLNIRARYLIVPVALQTTAEVLLTALVGQDANPLSRLSVIADARLDASSTTAFYLAADPLLHSGIDLVTRAGANGLPKLDQKTRFATDGIEIRVLDDFYVKPNDFRALAGSFGA